MFWPTTWCKDRYSCLSSKDGSSTGDIFGLKADIAFTAFVHVFFVLFSLRFAACLLAWLLARFGVWGHRWALRMVRGRVSSSDLQTTGRHWATIQHCLKYAHSYQSFKWIPVGRGSAALEVTTSASHLTSSCVAWARSCENCSFANGCFQRIWLSNY